MAHVESKNSSYTLYCIIFSKEKKKVYSLSVPFFNFFFFLQAFEDSADSWISVLLISHTFSLTKKRGEGEGGNLATK
jgi:hypothetical protein